MKYGKTRSGTQNQVKEKLPLRGIARVTDISGTWLQRYINPLYEKLRASACEKKEGSPVGLTSSRV